MYCPGGWTGQKGQCPIGLGGGGPIRGQIDGTIQGKVIQFTVYWGGSKEGGSVGVYTGTIGPTGKIDGASYDKVQPNVKATWYSDTRMECASSADAAPTPATQTPAETRTGKVLGRVPTTGSAPQRSICDAARDARARNSPAAPGLEAQCRASQGPGKVLGRVPTAGSAPQRSICDAARDARARNSPAAPGLEAQCRASQQATQQTPPGTPETQKPPSALDLPVKKSSSNICYSPGSTDYNQITSFTPYKTIDECVKGGGRLASSGPGGPMSKGKPTSNQLPGPVSQGGGLPGRGGNPVSEDGASGRGGNPK